MLIGNVENLDNYKKNIAEQNIKVAETQKTNVSYEKNDDVNLNKSFTEYRNEKLSTSSLKNLDNISKILNKDEVKNNPENKNIPHYEVNIYNQNFGYNTESKDFFIKVKRQELELQYPTEEMMKMKIFVQEEMKKIEA